MIASTLVINRRDVDPLAIDELIEIKVLSLCVGDNSVCPDSGDRDFDIEEIELVEFNEAEGCDFTKDRWNRLQAKVQEHILNDGSLVRQIYEDALNER